VGREIHPPQNTGPVSSGESSTSAMAEASNSAGAEAMEVCLEEATA
jgi:hypothetical protein